jgi:hypothetical protein
VIVHEAEGVEQFEDVGWYRDAIARCETVNLNGELREVGN